MCITNGRTHGVCQGVLLVTEASDLSTTPLSDQCTIWLKPCDCDGKQRGRENNNCSDSTSCNADLKTLASKRDPICGSYSAAKFFTLKDRSDTLSHFRKGAFLLWMPLWVGESCRLNKEPNPSRRKLVVTNLFIINWIESGISGLTAIVDHH